MITKKDVQKYNFVFLYTHIKITILSVYLDKVQNKMQQALNKIKSSSVWPTLSKGNRNVGLHFDVKMLRMKISLPNPSHYHNNMPTTLIQ